MSGFEFLTAEDWNALLAKIAALPSDTDPIEGDITAYEGVGTNVSRDDHVHPDLSRAPDFDSGWFNLAQNANVNKAHGTGSTKLLVELHGRTSGGNISKFYGGWGAGGVGGWWMTLTTTDININRGIADTRFYDLRVFCWELT